MDRAQWLQTGSGERENDTGGNRENEAAEVTAWVYLKAITGMTKEERKPHSKRKYTKSRDIQLKRCKRHTQNNSSTQTRQMLTRVLTVLGLVRFLASVSQLLRWLYVLLLHDMNRGTEVTMTTGKDLTSCHLLGGIRKESAAATS